MKFKNIVQLNKIIFSIVLIIASIILTLNSIVPYEMFLLILVVCLYIIVNSLFYLFKTGITIQNDLIKISYVESISTWLFPKIHTYILEKKQIKGITKGVDAKKSTNMLVIQTNEEKYELKNMFFNSQIIKILDYCQKSGFIK